MDLTRQNSILLIKLESLQKQVDIYENLQKEIYRDFKQALHNYLHENFSELDREIFMKVLYGTPSQQTQQEKRKIPDEERRYAKSIFKEIAKETHPDKFPKDGEKEAIFKKAQSAVEEGDISSLKLIAKELAIPLPEVTTLDIKTLEKKIKILEEKLDNYPKTFPWLWNENNREDKHIRGFIKRTAKDGIRS